MAIKSNIVTVIEAGEAAAIEISVSPTTLPSSGGGITISGTVTAPSGSTVGNINIYVNGVRVWEYTTLRSAFTHTYTAPANAMTSPKTLSIQAVFWASPSFFAGGQTFKSNIVNVTEAAAPPPPKPFATVTVVSGSAWEAPGAEGGMVYPFGVVPAQGMSIVTHVDTNFPLVTDDPTYTLIAGQSAHQSHPLISHSFDIDVPMAPANLNPKIEYSTGIMVSIQNYVTGIYSNVIHDLFQPSYARSPLATLTISKVSLEKTVLEKAAACDGTVVTTGLRITADAELDISPGGDGATLADALADFDNAALTMYISSGVPSLEPDSNRQAIAFPGLPLPESAVSDMTVVSQASLPLNSLNEPTCTPDFYVQIFVQTTGYDEYAGVWSNAVKLSASQV